MTPKKLKGKITISRYQGSDNGIGIEIQDDLSRSSVIRIEITPEDFGNAITGMWSDCTFELRSSVVGMKAEHKTIVVPWSGYSFTDDDKRAAVAPFEVDGWKARLQDLGNSHRRTESGYSVSFDRHIPI